ncbi:FG-GAP-like repeat-containing protein [Jatrophihabitans cynanchi]|uniref:FG-GAP-like repeat-containing protein n=1 Tax=Jatrophihabitans cynanchi TaxID=2944128 RepID=A0ABY7JXI1_9ACTN|nr:GH25 family lysozyme [Jatrophihabitans sp. SB3-54]WAX56027.1 FG-GAP-like repeat-containing protein [Jatrophihabitans sp. SB3-54]
MVVWMAFAGVAALCATAVDALPPSHDSPIAPGGGGHAQAGAQAGLAPMVASARPAGVAGIDIASYQHPGGAEIDWSSVAGAGVKFAYVKASEGTTYVNPYYSDDALGAKTAGMYVGAYAFGRPDTNDPVEQADALLAAAPYRSDGRTLPPMIDLEGPYAGITGENDCWNLGSSAMRAWIGAFVNRLETKTGVRPLLYTSTNWWNACTASSTQFARLPLNIASWGSTSPAPLPAGWSSYTVWQYTASAQISGIQGDVDGDVFLGSVAALDALASPDRNIRLQGDVTGDGMADLVADYGSNTAVMASGGSAFATPAEWSSTPFYGVRATLSADVTGDGKSDLVAVNSGNTYVMTSTGTGFSAPRLWSGAAFYGVRATLSADVTGDGKSDLVAVNSGNTYVMTSTGTGFSAPRLWSGAAFYGVRATLSADVTGDGKSDLVAVNSGNTYVMTSTGTGFSAPRLWSGAAFYGVRATLSADVTGDGKSDLVAVNSGNTYVMTSTGTGFSAPRLWSGAAFYGVRATLSADVTGDGKSDLVAVNSGNTYVMTSTGTGFSTPQAWSTVFF